MNFLLMLLSRRTASIEYRYAKLSSEIAGTYTHERHDNTVTILNNGAAVAVVHLDQKFVIKPKGKTKHYYSDNALEAIRKCTMVITNWELIYYVGQKKLETVAKGTYVYCTAVKSQKRASGNYRLGLLKIVPIL